MKRFIIAVFLGMLAAPAYAATYYFSDCYWVPGADFNSTGSLCDHATISMCRRCYGSPQEPQGVVCTDVNCSEVTGGDCVSAPGIQETKGSRGNPWCLSPEIANDECVAAGDPYACCSGDQAGTCPGRKRRSFTAMSDGAAGSNLTTEIAAGDTVYLCAGACDGMGSAVWNIEASASTGNSNCTSGDKPTFWFPQVDGNDSTSRITVQVYCTNDTHSCERVSFTSDSNGNGIFDTGEPQVFMVNAKSTSTLFNDMSYITIDGDPLQRGERNIRFDNWGAQSGNTLFSFDCTDTGTGDSDDDNGVDNIVIRGIEVDGFGLEGWAGLDMYDSQCIRRVGTVDHLGDGGYIFKVNDLGGDFDIKQSTFRNICGMVTRFNNNPDPAAVFNVTDNLFVNGYQLSNDHDFNGPFPASGDGATFNYLRNTVVDFWSAFASEQNVNNLTIADNDISCSGTRRMGDFYGGGCQSAISVNDGDTPICGHCRLGDETDNLSRPLCTSDAQCTAINASWHCPECWGGKDVLITRNRIHGNGDTTFGRMEAGINWGASNNAGSLTNVGIENNILWGIVHPQNGGTSSCNDPYDNPLQLRSGIGVCTSSSGLQIQGNTLWSVENGITLTGGASVLDSNIVGGGTGVELMVFPSASTSTLTKNLFYDPASNPVNFNSVGYNCPAVTATGGGGLNNGITHTGNFCIMPVLEKTTGPFSTWNLHLKSTDTSGALNGDTACVGPTTDMDSQSRPYPEGGSCDVGADEQAPVTVIPPPDPPSASPEAGN